MPDQKPLNELEYLIQGADLDLVSVGTLYTVLLRTPVWILANKPWDGRQPDPELKTLVMKPEDGPQMLPIWTDTARTATARERYGDYPHPVQIMGGLALTQAGGAIGLVINPGDGFQMQLTPEGIDQLRQAFGPRIPTRA